jgi:hypothetical protein
MASVKYPDNFKSTFLPAVPLIGTGSRTIQSNYPRNDYLSRLQAVNAATGSSSTGLTPPADKIIVLQPGSRYLKIGLASEAFPKNIPHVIAKKSNSLQVKLFNTNIF